MKPKIAVVALALSLCAGCMWGRVQMNDTSIRERAARVRAGVTRADELSSVLRAEPTMRLPVGKRTVLGYSYADTKSHGLMLLAVNFMKTQTVTDTLYVEIGADGVVERIAVPPAREVQWEFWPF